MDNPHHDVSDLHRDIKVSFFGRAIISVTILLIAALLSYYLVSSPAKSEVEAEAKPHVVRVDTMPIFIAHHAIMIEGLGQVRAAEEIELKARVAGEVIAMDDDFVPGGFFNQGEMILQIDPADYELDVKMSQAALAQAQATFELEKGQQEIARDELTLLQDTMGKNLRSTDLALRKPQMDQAKASVDSARAQLEMSALNLSRTSLKAPFNALVIERQKKIGDVVSVQDVIATLARTDAYWIELEIPVQHLRWIRFAEGREKGSNAQIEMSSRMGVRNGYVRKMVGRVDSQSRLAQVIVEVPDPLLRGADQEKRQTSNRLILGDYVRVTITGATAAEEIARIEQRFLRDGNAVWLKRDGRLAIQPVEIVYQDRKYAYITSGVLHGDLLVTSGITTPVNGMAIVSRSLEDARTQGEPEDKPPQDNKG